jgi:hypothetical protein
VLVESLIPLESTATTQREHVFFDIDVKGGEKVWSGCYSWRSKNNSATFQGCHQCQRGILLAYFIGRVCFSLMERTRTTMENRKIIISGGGENSKQISNLGIKNISSGGGANNMQRSKLRRKSVRSG